jgi:hypothetical protein
MLREILRAETLTDDAQTLTILNFKDTHARNLTSPKLFPLSSQAFSPHSSTLPSLRDE